MLRAMNSTRETWRRAPRTPTSPWFIVDARKRRSHPDPPTQPHPLAHGDPAARSLRSTRWISSTTTEACSPGNRRGVPVCHPRHGNRRVRAQCRSRRLPGENVRAARGDGTPWYDGPTLLELLETVEAGQGDWTAEAVSPADTVGQSASFRSSGASAARSTSGCGRAGHAVSSPAPPKRPAHDGQAHSSDLPATSTGQ